MAWSIANKLCVVTGATSGIGRATALGLAALGARLVLVAREPSRADAVVERIKTLAPGASVSVVITDLGVQSDVRRAAREILAAHEHIDVLINNAGAINSTRMLTADGRERTFAVNHLAIHLLTTLLLERLIASAPARIINVSSHAHKRTRMRFDDLEGAKRYNGWEAYCQSKLANVLFTTALARRLVGQGVTVNCLHPGVVASRFAGETSGPVNWFFRFARAFLRTEEEGAATTLELATSPALEGITGRYFANRVEAKTSRAAHSREDAERLWEMSEALLLLPEIGARGFFLSKRS